MNLFFAEFWLFVLMPNSMIELIHNRCTCEPFKLTMAAYEKTNEQSGLVLFRYFVADKKSLFSGRLSKHRKRTLISRKSSS